MGKNDHPITTNECIKALESLPHRTPLEEQMLISLRQLANGDGVPLEEFFNSKSDERTEQNENY